MKRSAAFIIATVLALGATVPATAGPFEDGNAAYLRGDYSAALKLYGLAADQGAAAQNRLGDMYFWGDGVPQDMVKGVALIRLAAHQGNANAQNNLGHKYYDGRGVPMNYAEAAVWYRSAADQGHAEAQANLAYLYLNGEGVPQDYTYAYMWANLAAAQGWARGVERREIVSGKMSPAQLAEAQKLAREWKPTLPK